MTARIAVFTCFLVVGICLAEPHLGAGNRAEHISACGLRVPREYREAQFTSVYKFDVLEGGKPTNIRRVQNEFLRDEEAAHCIATWRLPSISGEGTAEFSWRHGGILESIKVGGKGFQKTLVFGNLRGSRRGQQ